MIKFTEKVSALSVEYLEKMSAENDQVYWEVLSSLSWAPKVISDKLQFDEMIFRSLFTFRLLWIMLPFQIESLYMK